MICDSSLLSFCYKDNIYNKQQSITQMWVRRSLELEKQLDLEWINELVRFTHQKDNKQRLENLKETYIDLYIQNLQEGLKPQEALEKAKLMILCFLFVLP